MSELSRKQRHLSTGETRQFDYRPVGVKNPLFARLGEKERSKKLLEYACFHKSDLDEADRDKDHAGSSSDNDDHHHHHHHEGSTSEFDAYSHKVRTDLMMPLTATTTKTTAAATAAAVDDSQLILVQKNAVFQPGWKTKCWRLIIQRFNTTATSPPQTCCVTFSTPPLWQVSHAEFVDKSQEASVELTALRDSRRASQGCTCSCVRADKLNLAKLRGELGKRRVESSSCGIYPYAVFSSVLEDVLLFDLAELTAAQGCRRVCYNFGFISVLVSCVSQPGCTKPLMW